MKKIIYHSTLFSMLTLLCVFAFSSSDTFAKEESAKLKVAFYPLESFFEYDENQKESGYAVEYLHKISEYTGYQIEYLPTDDWLTASAMVSSGEADILMPATKTMLSANSFSLSDYGILDTFHSILTLNSREDLFFSDTEKIPHLKIGVSIPFYEKTDITPSLKQLKIPFENLIFYDTFEDCRNALYQGEVDAVVANIVDMTSDMKMLARFNYITTYLAMPINSPYLNTINNALYQIKLEEPEFLSSLYKKYYSQRSIYPLTKQETQYINSVNELTFAFRDNNGHLSDYENDTIVGIYPDLAELLCQKLGMKCNKVLLNDLDEKELLTQKNLVFSNVYFDSIWDFDFNFRVTSPCLTLHYYQIQNNNAKLDKDKVKVAAVRNLQISNTYVVDNYSTEQILWYDDYVDCLNAVLDKDADITILNNYTSEFYLSLYQYSSLSATLLDFAHQTSFAIINDENGLLTSVLNKTLSQITDEDLNTIILRNSSNQKRENFLKIILYRHPLGFLLVVNAIICVLLLLLFMAFSIKQNKKKNALLQQATDAKSAFLSHVSHDMRTPMNAIIGFSDICLKEKPDLSTTMEYLQKISFSAKHLLNLINDVLDVSKIESGKIELHPKAILNTDLFNGIISIIKPQMDAKKIHFHLENDMTEPVYLEVDEVRVQQIFLNILSNATKFTPEGGEIECSIRSEFINEDMVRGHITIRDNGIGMSEKFLGELFEPFKQEHSPLAPTQIVGTGLGLSIVKNLIDLMGGTIQVNSQVGVGTEFIIELIAPVVNRESTPQESPASLPEKKEYHLENRRVLLVEDNALNQEIAEMFLQMEGILVELAENGQEAVNMFSASPINHFDAILMDIQMPIMDGFTATDTIRNLAREDSKTIPIIAMTADVFDNDKKESKLKGMNAQLFKPINAELLYDTLQSFMK